MSEQPPAEPQQPEPAAPSMPGFEPEDQKRKLIYLAVFVVFMGSLWLYHTITTAIAARNSQETLERIRSR